MSLFINPVSFQNDSVGRVAAFSSYDFYETETYTRKATYADAGLTVENPNPVIADGAGRFPAIYLANGESYRVVFSERKEVGVYDSIWTENGVLVGETGATAVAGFVTARDIYIYEDALAALEIYLQAGIGDPWLPANTYESIGPTGSGADHEWSGMDNILSSCSYVELQVTIQGTNSALTNSNLTARFRKTGTSFTSSNTIKAYAVTGGDAGSSILGSRTTVKVPVDSSNRFDVKWSGNVATNASLITIEVLGFGV